MFFGGVFFSKKFFAQYPKYVLGSSFQYAAGLLSFFLGGFSFFIFGYSVLLLG